MSLNTGRVLLSSITTASSQATVDFDDMMTSDYDIFELDFVKSQGVDNGEFMLFQLGTGSTYDSGASDYTEAGMRILSNTNVPSGFGDETSTGANIGQGLA